MFAPTDCTREVSGRSKVFSPTRCGESLLAEGTKGLPQAISSAVTSSLSVCGCVVFFRIVGAVLLAVLPLPPTAVSAALEVSAGCADFAALGGAAALYGCCACLSVLGVSVWAQLRLFAGAAYRPRLLVFSRAVHLVLLQLLVRVCAQLLPGSFTRPGKVFIINDRQYRIILSVAAAGSVLKPLGGNYAALPIVYFVV